MSSKATSPYTTVAALKAADALLGSERVWNAVSDVQSAWLDRYPRLVQEIGAIPEIATNATRDPRNHVDFLVKHGWEPQIKECGPDEFLLAAVMDLLGAWTREGDRAWIEKGGGFAAATVFAGVDVLVRRGTNEYCVHLRTKAGDDVWLEMLPSAPDGFDLAIEAGSRFLGSFDEADGFLGVTFPLISFSDKLELDWIKDLWTTAAAGHRARILEAKQALELKANHAGFRARASDEMRGVEECAEEVSVPPFVIDRPFLLAVTRPGAALPIFAAHLAQDAWKDPGTL